MTYVGLCCALFVSGVLIDIFWCLAAKYAVTGFPAGAAGSSFILTIVQTVAGWWVVSNSDFVGMVVYAAGCAAGSYVIVKWTSKRKPNSVQSGPK
jgi:hypothetical protein